MKHYTMKVGPYRDASLMSALNVIAVESPNGRWVGRCDHAAEITRITDMYEYRIRILKASRDVVESECNCASKSKEVMVVAERYKNWVCPMHGYKRL